MRLHALNCATLRPASGAIRLGRRGAVERTSAVCTCLVAELDRGLVLVDTGLGLLDVAVPLRRLGPGFLAAMHPRLDPNETAARQVERLGFSRQDVQDVVLTHLDPDHAGGLSDFPRARVHLFAAEHRAAVGQPELAPLGRYRPMQWAHRPRFELYQPDGPRWYGLDVVHQLRGLPPDLKLVSLPGHSRGHGGVALRSGCGWLLLTGDATLRPGALSWDFPPRPRWLNRSSPLVGSSARTRHRTVEQLAALGQEHAREIGLFSSHDPGDLERCRGWLGAT
ncbi:MAG: MBL fold metallo-hydrolase [Polyangiaceae bacterium]|nr:MBL fold metallo-hydrolase [Polyangiaceae bacterium]